MVRVLDAATQNAVRDRSRVIIRNFILVKVKPLAGGSPVFFGFTDFGEDVLINIVDGETGNTVSHTYYGDNAPIQSMDRIPLVIGITVNNVQVQLNPLHPIVQIMARGNDCRNAPVQIHRGYFDPDSMQPVAAPRIRFMGQVNGAPETTAAVGGQSIRILRLVSHTRELTRANTAKRSDETYRLRGGDRMGRYAGTAGQWEIWWGEAKTGQTAKAAPRKKFLGLF